MVFEDGDELVVLAEDDDTYSPAEKIFDCSDKPPPVPAAPRQTAEEILFCGWRRDMHHTILALDAMVAPNSRLHLMCDKKVVSDEPEEHPGMVDILADFVHGSALAEALAEAHGDGAPAGTPRPLQGTRSKNELGEDLPRLHNLKLNFITGKHTQRHANQQHLEDLLCVCTYPGHSLDRNCQRRSASTGITRNLSEKI
jgi:hypothetical protein